MGIQGIINREVLETVPTIFRSIQNSESQHERDQKTFVALREVGNATPWVGGMSSRQLTAFQKSVIDMFDFNNHYRLQADVPPYTVTENKGD